MDQIQEEEFVNQLKRYITETVSLSKVSDEELEEKIETLFLQKLDGEYCSMEQRVSIVEQVYSSIRGFGLLDTIIKDDNITEVMINGPEDIFI